MPDLSGAEASHETVAADETSATVPVARPSGAPPVGCAIAVGPQAGTVVSMTDRTTAQDDVPLVVACDGSSLGNPGPGGWAWYAHPGSWAAGSAPATTNNAMELQAVRSALESTTGAIELVCDSKYVIDALTRWVWGWRKRGWVTSSGSPVANRSCIEAILDLMRGRSVTFTWVRGHDGHPLNEAADIRARGAAEALRARRLPDTGPGWVQA